MTKLQTITQDQTTAVQINTLLSTISALRANLTHVEDVDNPRKLDGGVKCAIEATLIKACAALDSVLEEESRWSLKTQNVLEASLLRTYKLHQQLMDRQKQTVDNMELPHRKFPPNLFRLPSGQWVAILGQLEDINTAVFGLGNSPEEAVAAYDQIYKIKNENNVDSSTTINTGQPPSRRKNKRGSGEDTGEDGGSSPEPIQPD